MKLLKWWFPEKNGSTASIKQIYFATKFDNLILLDGKRKEIRLIGKETESFKQCFKTNTGLLL